MVLRTNVCVCTCCTVTIRLYVEEKVSKEVLEDRERTEQRQLAEIARKLWERNMGEDGESDKRDQG